MPAVGFSFTKRFFIEFIQNVRMCLAGMFKTLWKVFPRYFRNIIFVKRHVPCVNSYYVYYSLLPPQERFFFSPIRPRNVCFPDLMLSPAPAASNYLLPPAGPCLVVLRLVPVSKTTTKVTWAWGRGCFSWQQESCINLVSCFSPSSEILNSPFLAWLLNTCIFQSLVCTFSQVQPYLEFYNPPRKDLKNV